MSIIDPFFKDYHERQASKFWKKELQRQVVILLLILGVVLLLAAGETIGYYWGNL